jgi:hypothetical protein
MEGIKELMSVRGERQCLVDMGKIEWWQITESR